MRYLNQKPRLRSVRRTGLSAFDGGLSSDGTMGGIFGSKPPATHTIQEKYDYGYGASMTGQPTTIHKPRSKGDGGRHAAFLTGYNAATADRAAIDAAIRSAVAAKKTPTEIAEAAANAITGAPAAHEKLITDYLEGRIRAFAADISAVAGELMQAAYNAGVADAKARKARQTSRAFQEQYDEGYNDAAAIIAREDAAKAEAERKAAQAKADAEAAEQKRLAEEARLKAEAEAKAKAAEALKAAIAQEVKRVVPAPAPTPAAAPAPAPAPAASAPVAQALPTGQPNELVGARQYRDAVASKSTSEPDVKKIALIAVPLVVAVLLITRR